jgi:hypothetical protein
MEAEKDRQELSEIIDSQVLDKDDLYHNVTVSKASRATYAQFYGEGADETIFNMLDNHDLIEDEEEKGE